MGFVFLCIDGVQDFWGFMGTYDISFLFTVTGFMVLVVTLQQLSLGWILMVFIYVCNV